MTKERGFSLIELMIVVAIVAILAAIAVPSYRRYVVRANRADAQRALLDLAGREERFYYGANRYAKNLGELSATATLAGSNYTVSLDPAPATSTDFTVVATPVGNQLRDDAECQSLSLNRQGQQLSTGTASAATCWGH